MIYLIAGFVIEIFLKNNKKKDYKLEMAKAKLEWIGTDDWKEYQEMMNNLEERNVIQYPKNFTNNYWTKLI